MNILKLLYVSTILCTSCFITTSWNFNDDDSPPRMKRESTMPPSILESILADPIFAEFQPLHAQFKRQKEALGHQKNSGKIDEAEHGKQIKAIKAEFKKIKNAFRNKHNSKKLYSMLEAHKLIDELREIQTKEEAPLKEQFINNKKTYDRKKFEEERNKIERKHEAFRDFIRTFSQEPTTQKEKEVATKLEQLQNEYKDAWYNLKTTHMPKGQESYEKEMQFQKIADLMLEEHKQKQAQLVEQLETRRFAAALAQAAEEQQEAAIAEEIKREEAEFNARMKDHKQKSKATGFPLWGSAKL